VAPRYFLTKPMHIIFQFPIVDFRSILQDEQLRLTQPSWPSPNIANSFVRSFGRVKKRKLGGTNTWSAEEYFCDAHVSIKYDNLHKHRFQIGSNAETLIEDCYRRLYSDGNFMNKIELGFVDNLETCSARQSPTEYFELVDILRHYANLKVTIGKKQVILVKAGKPLAGRYCYASTVSAKMFKDLEKYVVAGQPCITIIVSPAYNMKMPEFAHHVGNFEANGEQIELWGYTLNHDGQYIKVWILKTPRANMVASFQDPAGAMLRDIRINLMRVHAEKETVRVLLNGINDKLIDLEWSTERTAKLQQYLKKISSKLLLERRLDIDQRSILEFALKSEDVLTPGEFTTLWESIAAFTDKYFRQTADRLVKQMQLKTILFLTSNPKDKNQLDFSHELEKIEEALKSGARRGEFQIKKKLTVMKNDLIHLLNEHTPDYVHIVLHASKTKGLYFEDADGNSLPMDINEFAEVIELYSSIKRPIVIILSACNSKSYADSVVGYCDFAVGTNEVFPDKAGVAYARNFYATLFESSNFDIRYCHRVGVLGIKNYTPKFDDINGTPVHKIPELLKA
jgi:hypothetical protein